MSHPETSLSTPLSNSLILGSYLLAIILSVAALSTASLYWLPPLPLLVVLYWSTLDLKRTFIASAFILGLLYDALTQSILGWHALLFVLVTFIVLRYRLQFRIYTLLQQAAILVLLFYGYQLLSLLIKPQEMQLGIPLSYWLSPLSLFILWPLVALTLKWFQNRFNA